MPPGHLFSPVSLSNLAKVVEHNFQKAPWDESKAGQSRAAVTASVVAEMATLLRTVAAPMPGLAKAMEFVKGKGMRLAVASSSPMVLIEAGLARLGFSEGVFEVVCSAEKEPLGKPHPGVYLTAAAKLGVDPTNCKMKSHTHIY